MVFRIDKKAKRKAAWKKFRKARNTLLQMKRALANKFFKRRRIIDKEVAQAMHEPLQPGSLAKQMEKQTGVRPNTAVTARGTHKLSKDAQEPKGNPFQRATDNQGKARGWFKRLTDRALRRMRKDPAIRRMNKS
jgi:hypothetical protein